MQSSNSNRAGTVELLVRELSRESLKRRVGDLVKEKNEAPLDLLVDMLLENRNDVGEEQWKQTVEIASTIAESICNAKKMKTALPDCDYRKCADLIGGEFSFNRLPPSRIIADRLLVQRGFEKSIAIVSERLDSEACAECYVLLRANQRSQAKPDLGVKYGGCFVFSDGDLACELISGCIVIARGSVRSKRTVDSIVIENASHGSLIRFFMPERVGLKLIQDGEQIRVKDVFPGSNADKCGIKSGDAIQSDKKPKDSIAALTRQLRLAYATETELELRIKRGIEKKMIILSFGE